MRTVIGFYLRRRFYNRTALILNLVLFLAVGVVFHLDKIFAEKEEYPVYLDASCQKVAVQLISLDSLYIDSTEEVDKYHILHYDEGWLLQICEGNGLEVRNKVETDLRELRKQRYLQGADLKTREFLDRFCQSFKVETQKVNRIDASMVMVSVVFYLVLTYSNMIANEFIYEKASHTLELVISLIGERVHFLSKLITAYLSLMIQVLSVVISGLLWLFIRFQEDHLRGLLEYANSSEITEGISLSVEKRLLIFVSIVAGLLLLQIIMLIITSLLGNSEEVAAFQNIYYILLVIIYYVFILKNQTDLFTGALAGLLSYVPIASMLVMPLRLINNTASTAEALISLIITVTVTAVSCEAYLSRYRRILLK